MEKDKKFWRENEHNGRLVCIQQTSAGTHVCGWIKRCPICRSRVAFPIPAVIIPNKVFDFIDKRTILCEVCAPKVWAYGIRLFERKISEDRARKERAIFEERVRNAVILPRE